VIGYFPWRCAADVPSETYHDEARKIFDREHLRAGKTPRNAQTRDRSRDRQKYARKLTASTHPGSAGRGSLCPRTWFASAGHMQGVGRRNDLRIPHPGPEAIIG